MQHLAGQRRDGYFNDIGNIQQYSFRKWEEGWNGYCRQKVERAWNSDFSCETPYSLISMGPDSSKTTSEMGHKNSKSAFPCKWSW